MMFTACCRLMARENCDKKQEKKNQAEKKLLVKTMMIKLRVLCLASFYLFCHKFMNNLRPKNLSKDNACTLKVFRNL